MENINKDFSDGFMQDLAMIIEYCKDNETDSCELEFMIGDKCLEVNISYTIK